MPFCFDDFIIEYFNLPNDDRVFSSGIRLLIQRIPKGVEFIELRKYQNWLIFNPIELFPNYYIYPI